MKNASTDILMITYNRPAYTRRSVARLLEACDDHTRIWLWHNGPHRETLEIVRSFLGHPRIHQFHHSSTNQYLTAPTNWLWDNAEGELLGKVDDDCLVPDGWIETLRKAHMDEPRFGAIACWHYAKEDFEIELAQKKIHEFAEGHKILRTCWVGGTGYLMKRECVEQKGLLRSGGSWTKYCIDLAMAGWINGFYYPLLYQDHMDDPRSVYTQLKSDADLQRHRPLSTSKFGGTTLDAWTAALKGDARYNLEASIDPRVYRGWRPRVRSIIRRMGIRRSY